MADANKPERRTQVIPSREAVLQGQLHLLMGTAVPLMQFIANTRDTKEDEGSISPVDGGVKCSVEASLMGLCARLDKIVTDDTNWNMDGYHQMEKQYTALMEAQSDALRAQRNTSDILSRPHMRMRPELLKLDVGGWAAILGTLGESSAIIGLGYCPAAALDAFDRAFDGQQASAQFVNCDTQEHQPKNEKASMDTRRGQVSVDPPAPQDPQGNGGRAQRKRSRRRRET